MNILYDPRIRAGMTVDEVRAILPPSCRRAKLGREDQ